MSGRSPVMNGVHRTPTDEDWTSTEQEPNKYQTKWIANVHSPDAIIHSCPFQVLNMLKTFHLTEWTWTDVNVQGTDSLDEKQLETDANGEEQIFFFIHSKFVSAIRWSDQRLKDWELGIHFYGCQMAEFLRVSKQCKNITSYLLMKCLDSSIS